MQESTRKVILRLKEARAQKNLTYQDIVDACEAQNESVSLSTVRRIFSKGSEDGADYRTYTINASFRAVIGTEDIALTDAEEAALGIASCLHGSHCIFHPVSFIWNLFRKWRIHKHKLRAASDRSSIPQSTQRQAHRPIPAGGNHCRLQGFAHRHQLCFN